MATAGAYRLELEPQKRNVFVTQLREEEEEEDAEIRRFPVVHETASKLLDTGFNTVQSTLLLKKQIEVEKVQEDLDIKRQQFADRMSSCKSKEEELKKKQQQIHERVGKFEKFIKENDAKRRRAIQKYQTELRLKEQKTGELDLLWHELERLKAKKESLHTKVTKYSVYEQYLTKVLDKLPEDYLEASDSMLMGIMMRFRTLNATNQTLVQMLSNQSDQVEIEQQHLQDMNQEHNQNLLMINSKLATLQDNLEEMTQRSAHLDQVIIDTRTIYRQHSEMLGCIKLAIDNIAEKCTRLDSRPVERIEFDEKLKIIQDHILESTDICRLARPPAESTPPSTEWAHPSPSILKKDSRISRPMLDSPMKSSPSRGLRNFQLALRFAAGSKR